MLIDGEHGLVCEKDYYEVIAKMSRQPFHASILTCFQLSAVVASEGASPIVRIPVAEEWMIKRALDAGAHGILTPMCHTAVRDLWLVGWFARPWIGRTGYEFIAESTVRRMPPAS